MPKASSLGVCDSVIVSLSNAMEVQNQRFTNAGLLYALNNPQNANAIQVIGADKGDGMVSAYDNAGAIVPRVRVRYYPPQTSASGTTKTCTATENERPTETTRDITLYRQRTFTLTRAFISSLCADSTKVTNAIKVNDFDAGKALQSARMEEVRQIIYSHARALVRDVNADLLTKVVANIGKNSRTGATTAVDINLFNADGTMRHDGMAQIQTDYVYNEFQGRPIIVGGGLFYKYLTTIQWGDLSASGVDYSKVLSTNPVDAYFDRTFDASPLAVDNFLVLAPSMVGFLQYVQYAGMFSAGHGTSEFGTFELPELPNVKFDLQVKQTDCDTPSFTFIMSMSFDAFVAPDWHKAGDVLTGVTGVLRYKGIQL